jgi:4-diphosphocytidyl-2-C-methyl-D-erythritol kinase
VSSHAPALVELPAPAKVNLGLRVVGRRSDGYHLIESLFVPLDLADEVRVEVLAGGREGVSLSLEVDPLLGGAADLRAEADNLAVRAARVFLEAADLSAAVRVRVRKRIPVAAGLGGGSSDAGAVLRALMRLFPAALPEGEVARLALGLGADVPYFLDPRPALVSGIGEVIEPVGGVPELLLLLANPGESLATAEVYGAVDALGPSLTRVEPGSTLRALSGLWSDSNAFAKLLENDLEEAAVRLCPAISILRERIRAAGALAAGMSGSGATVVGVFSDQAAAGRALERVRSESGVWALTARTRGSRAGR